MASPNSCKGKNKEGQNFQNCGGKEQYYLISSVVLAYLMISSLFFIVPSRFYE